MLSKAQPYNKFNYCDHQWASGDHKVDSGVIMLSAGSLSDFLGLSSGFQQPSRGALGQSNGVNPSSGSAETIKWPLLTM